MKNDSIANLHNGGFYDDDLYIAFELLNFLAFFSKKNPIFSIERTPKSYLEEDLNSRLQFLLEHIFGIEFELIDAELCEYKLSPTSESVTIVSNYIDNQIYNFSLNSESKNLSSISNVPTFLVHIETIKRILKKQQTFYGDTFLLSAEDFPEIKGLLFIHPLLYLWKQEEVIQNIEINVQNAFDENIEAPVFSAKITLNENCSLDYNHSAVSQISYVSGKGIFYKEVLKTLKLTRSEQRFCIYFYEINKNNAHASTQEAIDYVYNDGVADNSSAFKSLIKRFNNKLSRKLLLDTNPIKFETNILKKVL